MGLRGKDKWTETQTIAVSRIPSLSGLACRWSRPAPVWGFLGRSPDSGSHPRNLDQDESDPVILSGPGLKQVPRAPFERRWDKEISGGQEERKARIKKIMQTDEEIGKVAAAVPVIISRALELFLESLLKKACQVTQSRNAKTMTTSHLKQCIELEQQFDFLKDLVASVPDMQGDGEDNHMDGDKGARRGRKPGNSGRKNGGMGSKGKDKKLSGTDSEQEDESEDTDTDGEEETPQALPQASHPPAHFQSPPTPFMPFTSTLPLPPAPPGPSAPDAEDEEDYDS